jgi:hypothetical protein
MGYAHLFILWGESPGKERSTGDSGGLGLIAPVCYRAKRLKATVLEARGRLWSCQLGMVIDRVGSGRVTCEGRQILYNPYSVGTRDIQPRSSGKRHQQEIMLD